MQILYCPLLKKYFVSTVPDISLAVFSRLVWQRTSDVSKPQNDSGISKSRPCKILTCPYMPVTLEGGGIISQLRQLRSHAPSKATPSSMSAKLRNNQLSIYSIFFEEEEVWMRQQFVLREQTGPHESLNCPADCPVEGKHSLHMSCVIKPWGSLCPSLLMTMGSKIVENFATALTQTAVFISFIFSLLDRGTLWASCASGSSNILAKAIQQVSSLWRTHDNINNETSVNSPASCKEKKNKKTERFLSFCFRQSQVKW